MSKVEPKQRKAPLAPKLTPSASPELPAHETSREDEFQTFTEDDLKPKYEKW